MKKVKSLFLEDKDKGNTQTEETVAPIVKPIPGKNTVPGASLPMDVPGIEPISPYDQAKEEYLKTINTPANKQGRAAQIAFQAFRAMENAGRALNGQPLTEFQWLGEAKKENRDMEAYNKFAPHLQRRQLEQVEATQAAELRSKQVKALGDEADAQKKILESIRSRNPEFYDSLTKRGYITQEDADFAEKNGYGKLAVGDFRKVDTEQINGVTYERPETGGEKWKESSLPVEKSKQLIERRLPDGTQFFTTGDKEADRQAQQAFRQAQLDMEAGKFNEQQLQGYQDDLQSWSQAEARRQEDNNRYTTEMGIASKEAQAKREEAARIRSRITKDMKDTDPAEYYKLQREIDQLESSAKVLQEKSDGLYLQVQRSRPAKMPTKPNANLRAPNISDRTMTKAEYDAAVKKFGKAKADSMIKSGGWTVR